MEESKVDPKKAVLIEIGYGQEKLIDLDEFLSAKNKHFRAQYVYFTFARKCKIEANYCIIKGNYNIITGSNNIIIGNNNVLDCPHSLVFGDDCSIGNNSEFSIINGYNTFLSAQKTLTRGYSTRPQPTLCGTSNYCIVDTYPCTDINSLWAERLDGKTDISSTFEKLYCQAYEKASLLLPGMPLKGQSAVYPGFDIIFMEVAARFTFVPSVSAKIVKQTFNNFEISILNDNFLYDDLIVKDFARVYLNGTKIPKRCFQPPRSKPYTISDLKLLLQNPPEKLDLDNKKLCPDQPVDKPDANNQKLLLDQPLEKPDADNKKLLLDQPVEKPDADECSICLDDPIDTALIPCGHMAFCYNCASSLASKSCPLCRMPFVQLLKIYKS